MKSRIHAATLAFCLAAAIASPAQDLDQIRKMLSPSSAGNDNSGLEMRRPIVPGVEEDVMTQSPMEATAMVGDGPLDSNYVIGPGDQFQVYIESAALDKQVNAEGNIVINRIGVIPVAGLTLKAAKQAILEKVQSKKIKSQCFVNLGRPKTMRVFLTGAVTLPGAYQVGGYLHLTDLLQQAGGLAATAQRGPIRILSRTGAETRVDLKKFYLEGDLASNPYLTQGSIVMVPFIEYDKPTVQIRRDSLNQLVQLEPDENLFDILLKAWAYKAPPPFAAVLVREGDAKPKVLAATEIRGYHPAAGAIVEVVPQRRDVYVGGAVFKPGYLPFRSDLRVSQYISDAGLISSSQIPGHITVYRADGSQATLDANRDVMQPGDMVFVGQNAEQKFINYTPILLSVASLTLAILTVMGK